MNEKKLQERFNFDAADLEANRKGRLTEKQKKRFQPRADSSGWAAWGLGVFFLFIAGSGLLIAWQFVLGDEDLIGKIIFGLGFGIIWPLVWGGIGVTMVVPSRRPAYHPRVKAERGRLQIVKHEPQDGIPFHEIKVGERSVETDNDLADVVAEGEEYALYYLQKTGEMVSLERVSASQGK